MEQEPRKTNGPDVEGCGLYVLAVGSIVAALLSFKLSNSMWWIALHALLSWFYVGYYALAHYWNLF